MAVAGLVAGSGSIQAEEASETVQPQFAMQNREGMPLEVFIAHLFEGNHMATSRYQNTGSGRAAEQVVVSCQEHIGLTLLGVGQMQSIEVAEPKLLQERRALCRARSWDHYFIRERQAEQRRHVVALHPGCG